MKVPHIELRWDTSDKPATSAVNLYPETKLLAKVRVFINITNTITKTQRNATVKFMIKSNELNMIQQAD